jgi:hypothetical protein
LEAAYVEQLQCVDRMILELVRWLIHRSDVLPVILLQGDHGTGFLRFAQAPSVDQVTMAQARERFGAFGAYYLPGGGGDALGDTLTLVNLFPSVFNYYFGAHIPRAPDDLFMSVDAAPYRFRRLTPESLTARRSPVTP